MVTSLKSRPIDKDPLTHQQRVTTYCNQECSTCGRRLRIRIEYLGHELVCPHCQGHFRPGLAADDVVRNRRACSVLERANRLLEALERYGDGVGSDGVSGSDPVTVRQHVR